MTPKVVLGLIVVAFLAIYARTVTYAYVWDDVSHIAENPIYDGPVLDGLLATQHDHIDPNLRKLSGTEPAHDSYAYLPLAGFALRSERYLRYWARCG